MKWDKPSSGFWFYLIATIGTVGYLVFLYRYGYGYLNTHFIDAPSFWAAADATFNLHRSPYASDFGGAAEQSAGQYTHPFIYPPPSLLLLYPLSWFDYPTAANGLLLVNHLAIAWICVLLLRAVFPGGWRQSLGTAGASVWLCFYVMLFQATRITLGHGQVNLLVLLLVVLFWRMLASDRSDWWKALPLALAALLKVYPFLFVGMLVASGRLRAALATIVWIGIFAGLSIVLISEEVWVQWLREIAPTGGYGQSIGGQFSQASPNNLSINGWVARLFLDNPYTDSPLQCAQSARLIAYLTSLIVVAGTLTTSFLLSRRIRSDFLDIEVALYLCASFLIAPISWIHHLVFVIPAMIILLTHFTRNHNWIPALLTAGCMLVLFQDLMPPGNRATGVVAILAMAPQPYVVISLWILGIYAALWSLRQMNC